MILKILIPILINLVWCQFDGHVMTHVTQDFDANFDPLYECP